MSIVLSVAGFLGACRLLLHTPSAPAAWLHFAGCGMIGIVTAYIFVWIAQYYTGQFCIGLLKGMLSWMTQYHTGQHCSSLGRLGREGRHELAHAPLHRPLLYNTPQHWLPQSLANVI